MTATIESLIETTTPSERARGKLRTRSARLGRVDVTTAGGAPRVDLLPQEVHVERRARQAVRRAWLAVGVVGVAVSLGVAAATATSMTAGSELSAAEAETSALLGQQGRYAEVRGDEAQADLLEAAQKVGGATEIDWSAYLRSVQATLPSTVTISSVTVDSASPVAEFAQATGPLQAQRVATLTIVATSPTLPSVPDWLDSLRSLQGYVDASADSVTLASATGSSGYTVDMTIHVDAKAYDGRYTGGAKQ